MKDANTKGLTQIKMKADSLGPGSVDRDECLLSRLPIISFLFCGSLAVVGTVEATMPPRSAVARPELAQAFQDGVLDYSRPASDLPQSAIPQPVWVIPLILIDFTDQPLSYGPGDFDLALFDSTGTTATGSVYDYYSWSSAGRMRVCGRVVATVHLPNTKNYYALNAWGLGSSTPHNIYGAVEEALRVSDPLVDWAQFDQDRDGYVDMLWVAHSGLGGEVTVARDNLWSITSRMSAWWFGSTYVTNDPMPGAPAVKMKVERFSMLPELSAVRPGALSEICVYCHEFGHALGLPDLYDTHAFGGPLNVGPGNWSLMSTGGYGGDGVSPEYPTGLGAWPLQFMGWTETLFPDHDETIVLGPQELGGSVIRLWFQGESHPEHFLIENRQRLGFDRNLPGEGLILYHLDEAAAMARVAGNTVNSGPYPAYRLVEGDGFDDLLRGQNRGAADDPFPGAGLRTFWDDETVPSSRTFAGVVTNVGIREIVPDGDDVRFYLQVRARGWLAPLDRSVGGYSPVFSSGTAVRAVKDGTEGIAATCSEVRNGLPQVVVRLKSSGGTWAAPQPLSASPTGALQPSIARLPGRDLAVVWSDLRHGAAELYYRARIQGGWTPEVRLTELPGSSSHPSISADPSGGVHVAWLYTTSAGASELRFLHFAYASPYGDPRPVSDPGEVPEHPIVAAAPDGSSYIFWSDRATQPPQIWFARFHPDSGVQDRARLAPFTAGSQPTVAAVVDAAGNIHAVWTVLSTSGAELRYQLRPNGPIRPMPPDTTIAFLNGQVQSPVITLDPNGGVHVAFEATVSGTPQIRYIHRDPTRGWDVASTEVTEIQQGIGARPSLLAFHPRVASVLYSGFPQGNPTFFERERNDFVGLVPTSVPSASLPPAPFHIGPNPVRPGGVLEVRGSGASPHDPIEVFDVSGRRVAAVTARESGAAWSARFGPGVTGTWASGVYLVRLRDSGQVGRIVVLR